MGARVFVLILCHCFLTWTSKHQFRYPTLSDQYQVFLILHLGSLSDCTPTYTRYNNSNAPGGEAQTFSDADTCLAECAANSECVGADVNFGGGVLCWFHLSADNLQQRRAANGVYHYVLTDRCESTY